MSSLTNRRIFITGVSRGIGRATARLFLAEGASIVGCARDEARLAETRAVLLKEAGPSAADRFEAFALDLTDPGAPARAAARIAARWGALDVLINNAAIMTEGPATLDDEPDGTFERTLSVNLVAPFRLARALIPLLRAGREPRIVHVTSGAGTFAALAETGIASYRLSKWALNGLVRLQAENLAGAIAVNGLDPGWVKTDLGGPRAPGVPEDSARGALALVREPFTTTGKLFKDGGEIAY
ncbi:MAG TPA: SDR family NAD(P)-dependent oxidoreductase [Polyangia bacterium]|nr:SDR family NAD(P)-dependent oxidoreductase [Polyangia bacterium]